MKDKRVQENILFWATVVMLNVYQILDCVDGNLARTVKKSFLANLLIA